MRSLIKGSIAGLAATWPMTGTMLGLRRHMPEEWFRALPPRRITLRAARKAGALPHLGWNERKAFTWISHFGFGAAAGATYAFLPGRVSRSPGLAGPLFGLAVWTIAYLGLMPALGLYPSALKERASRNWLMILSHLVWGLSLGLVYRLLESRRVGEWTGKVQSGSLGLSRANSQAPIKAPAKVKNAQVSPEPI